MRILVTGREGQVARALAENPRGHHLIFVGRPEMDLTDFPAIERAILGARPDVIISAAAYTAVDSAEGEPELAMRINGDAPGVIARTAAAVGASIIHLSTDYVFDGSSERPWREDDPTAPLGVYGGSKLAGERAVAAAGGRHAIVRTSWVYSPFGRNFVKTMLRLAADRDQLEVVGDQVGNPTSAYDIAEALIVMAECGWEDGVFHFAGAGSASWAEFAREIFAVSAAAGGPEARVKEISTAEYPASARRPANSRLDCARFATHFGHRAPPWQQSLAAVVRRLVGPA